MHSPLLFYGLGPSKNHVLLFTIEDIANHNVGLPVIVKSPCGVDRRILSFDLINDDVTLMHALRFSILGPRDPNGRAN